MLFKIQNTLINSRFVKKIVQLPNPISMPIDETTAKFGVISIQKTTPSDQTQTFRVVVIYQDNSQDEFHYSTLQEANEAFRAILSYQH